MARHIASLDPTIATTMPVAVLRNVATARQPRAFLLCGVFPQAPCESALVLAALLRQIAWLEGEGIRVTLVSDDRRVGAFFGGREHGGRVRPGLAPHLRDLRAGRVAICSVGAAYKQINELARQGFASGIHEPIVVMPAPLLCKRNLLRRAKRKRTHSAEQPEGITLWQDPRGRPVFVAGNAAAVAAAWAQILERLQLAAHSSADNANSRNHSSSATPLGKQGTRSPDPTRRAGESRLLWRGVTARVIRRPYAAHHGVVVHPTAHVASSARLRGPVFIGEGVTIEAGAHIGPWVAIDRAARVGEGAFLEHCVIGAGASLALGACVYASEIAPGVSVAPKTPILHSRFLDDTIPPLVVDDADTLPRPVRLYRVLSRLLDIAVSATALILLAPVLVLLMLLCALDTGWPPLFVHSRLGFGGKPIRVFKFRSMHPGRATDPAALRALADSSHFKLRTDPRITRLGSFLRKTSLDELPQLLNILRGDMTLVGPRPIVNDEAVRFGPYLTALLSVHPGVTGLWQVSGRSETTYARRIMLDVKYATIHHPLLDLSILLRTLPALLSKRGAH